MKRRDFLKKSIYLGLSVEVASLLSGCNADSVFGPSLEATVYYEDLDGSFKKLSNNVPTYTKKFMIKFKDVTTSDSDYISLSVDRESYQTYFADSSTAYIEINDELKFKNGTKYTIKLDGRLLEDDSVRTNGEPMHADDIETYFITTPVVLSKEIVTLDGNHDSKIINVDGLKINNKIITDYRVKKVVLDNDSNTTPNKLQRMAEIKIVSHERIEFKIKEEQGDALLRIVVQSENKEYFAKLLLKVI